MENILKITLILGLLLCGISKVKGSILDSLVLREYASDMHSWEGMKKEVGDSITDYWWGEKRYFNRDSLFTHCARKGLEAMKVQMSYYFSDVVDVLRDGEARREETRKMREAIERIGVERLEGVLDYGQAIALPDSTEELFVAKMEQFYKVADKYAARGDVAVEMWALRYIFVKSFDYTNYHIAFLCAPRLEKRLDEVTDAEYSGRYADFFELGNAYYQFRDFERAIPLLKKALHEGPVPHFTDRYNLRARNTLGVYYRDQGDLELSDYYFRSMLGSEDMVKFRPMYDCIALSNLGTNLRARGNFPVALKLHRLALPRSISEKDWSFTSGIYVGLAECYLEMNRLDSCKMMIDSTFYYIHQVRWQMPWRLSELYPIMARYYVATGDTQLSLAYMDSTTAALRRVDEEFSALKLLYAQRETFGSERLNKEIELGKLRRMSMMAWTAAAVIFAGLVVLGVLYRRKQRAYRLLVKRSREWAKQRAVVASPACVDAGEVALMEQISKVMKEECLYLSPSFNMEVLAERLGVRRDQVSRAINGVCGKAFSVYVNEWRVSHAILLLSDPINDKFSLETIGYDAGFASRATFYRVFKDYTKISPALYRKNRK